MRGVLQARRRTRTQAGGSMSRCSDVSHVWNTHPGTGGHASGTPWMWCW